MTPSKKDKSISQQKQQQRSKRHRSEPVPKDPNQCDSPSSIREKLPRSDESRRQEEKEYRKKSLVILVSNEDEHEKRMLVKSGEQTSNSSLLSRQSNASTKRQWIHTHNKDHTTVSSTISRRSDQVLIEEARTSNSNNDFLLDAHSLPCTFDPFVNDKASSLSHDILEEQQRQHQPPICNDGNHDRSPYLFRRKAAVPTQLLKWAFDASMSLYDHLGDDDDEDSDDYHDDDGCDLCEEQGDDHDCEESSSKLETPLWNNDDKDHHHHHGIHSSHFSVAHGIAISKTKKVELRALHEQ